MLHPSQSYVFLCWTLHSKANYTFWPIHSARRLCQCQMPSVPHWRLPFNTITPRIPRIPSRRRETMHQLPAPDSLFINFPSRAMPVFSPLLWETSPPNLEITPLGIALIFLSKAIKQVQLPFFLRHLCISPLMHPFLLQILQRCWLQLLEMRLPLHLCVRVISVLSFSRFTETAVKLGIQDPQMQVKFTMAKKRKRMQL